jgi:Replication-relaxation
MTRPPPDRQISRSEGDGGGRIGSPTRSVTRTLPRPRSSASILHSSSGTTRRDLSLCLDLHEHRVLTTHQIFELRFPSPRRAQRRLLILQQRGTVERFRPFRSTGSHPWHYILGEVGIEMVASWRGVERKELGLRMDRLRGIAYSPRLAHLVEVNGFFSRLAYRCRTDRLLELVEWWSERRCAAEWRGMVRPDGMGRLEGPGARVRFFLELDRGTESSSRLEEKLARYARVARLADAPEALLFLFPTERREAEARRALINCGLLVLTGSRRFAGEEPLSPCWLPIEGDRRLRITDVGSARRSG